MLKKVKLIDSKESLFTLFGSPDTIIDNYIYFYDTDIDIQPEHSKKEKIQEMIYLEYVLAYYLKYDSVFLSSIVFTEKSKNLTIILDKQQINFGYSMDTFFEAYNIIENEEEYRINVIEPISGRYLTDTYLIFTENNNIEFCFTSNKKINYIHIAYSFYSRPYVKK